MQHLRLSLALLVGCSAPSSGAWTFAVTQDEGDCPAGYSPAEEPTGDNQIEPDPDGTEVVYVDKDVDIKMHCPWSGADFACSFDETDDTQHFSDQGLEAAYTVDALLDGHFDSDKDAHGVTTLTTTCGGTECDLLAADGLPACTIAWYWTALFAE